VSDKKKAAAAAQAKAKKMAPIRIKLGPLGGKRKKSCSVSSAAGSDIMELNKVVV